MRLGSWVCRCQKGLMSQQGKPFSHRGGGVTAKERDVVREIKRKRRRVGDRLKFRKKI